MFAVKAIVPATGLSVERILQAVNDALDTGARWVQSDFEQTISTWDTKPEFTITTPHDFARDIKTEDIVYGYVNQGTRPHEIYARNARALRFTRPFAPKTQKNVIGSYAGNRGEDVVITPRVFHPGITPREFDETIAREWIDENRLQKLIQDEIDRAIG